MKLVVHEIWRKDQTMYQLLCQEHLTEVVLRSLVLALALMLSLASGLHPPGAPRDVRCRLLPQQSTQ